MAGSWKRAQVERDCQGSQTRGQSQQSGNVGSFKLVESFLTTSGKL